ncbi:SpoIIE family protein phosphatase [Kitasatospora sp. A2-31]|uniref:SpoIIE family protein phosphatase n=2 Tax=Kitasatospora sp. A2-31 TaxID=2916414 RepID=UPI001EE9B77E|nr:SpoIIE family protein phosphatase [Kitasatospora sp. A2-31]MCG6498280.1 SpoIIE family protein phosphatase [Kitasatospora sp. A2-31]
MRQGVPADPSGPQPTARARATRPDPHRPRRSDAAARAAHERDSLLATTARNTLESTGAYGALVYLRSRDRRSLVLCTIAGVPLSLMSAFRRVAAAGPMPVAVCYRTGRTITLSDTEDTMRRFPQLAVGLPYDYASACVPVRRGEARYGVVSALWPSSDDGVPEEARSHLRKAADRLAAGLAQLEEAGYPIEPNGDTAVVELAPPGPPTTRVGLFDWNVATGAISADDQFCEILGLDPAEFDGRAASLTTRIAPGDLPEFRAAARAALDHGRMLAARVRVLDRDGHHYPVELWARVPEGVPDGRAHLVGAVLDTRTGTAAAAAVERLHDGVFSLDPDGRITYANRSVELLLRARREDLVGHHPWEVLPWLSDPVYENRYRAAMLSQQPTAFLAARPPDDWFAFSLYPDAHGVTGRVVAAEPPPGRTGKPTEPEPDLGARPGVGGMYHLLQLASALSEAVTVREVCRAVEEQILPAFGGQELAIYAVRDKRLHLISQSGYPDGFLDRFEGTPTGARVPGAETLSTGAPIFFENVHALAAAYPGIALDEMGAWAFLPLIASGHPVGSCIIGFDEPRAFTVEERGLLTGLGGFIAQALERARLYDAEFTLARGLQQALLPHRLPLLEDVRIAARYLPGTQGMEIGGDWYDAIVTGRDLTLVIGDVEGHSVGAAATMGQLRSAVRAFATSGHAPDEVLVRTNLLLLDLDPGLLASCCLIRFTPSDGSALVARAGHLPPVVRHPDGSSEALYVEGGPLLGIDNLAEYPVSELELARGSLIALYTDGLVEDPAIAIDQGVDRLRLALGELGGSAGEGDPADGDLDRMAERLLREVGSTERVDDVALMLTAYGRLPGDRRS